MALDVYVCTENLGIIPSTNVLPITAYAVASLFPVLSGLPLLCLVSQVEQGLTGSSYSHLALPINNVSYIGSSPRRKSKLLAEECLRREKCLPVFSNGKISSVGIQHGTSGFVSPCRLTLRWC